MSLLSIHMLLMSLACVTMISAIIAARFFKKKKWWLKVHRRLNTLAAAIAFAGLGFAIAMVQVAGGERSLSPHRIGGAFALLLMAGLLYVGSSIFTVKGKEAIASRKTLHRMAGRVEAVLMPAVIVFGLMFIGLL
jgi:hypothetical protein